ncbi:MAG: 3-oxoacyl-ACP reductase [Haliea sp.]|uniref:SDR family NAD(P)-dependent oxidoreductase n=1 Tax=Haliea sp. TaxID=1932666 RepID=UPI000C6A582E|nr:SDR family oxidoreductase [Haliea sp.]MBM68504.1 3-oxoacyl-ACP reductase [Haliea sp.]|tara:strand:- start:86415 stop:87140 length:726 start_codon:yes stop_codon:yes gene_type:complete
MSLVNALDFTGKKVLVCGASDGIGYGVAKAFLEAGAEVAITGTRSEGDYDNDFSGMQFHSLNIQDPEAISALATKFDALDVMVNCIGSVLWKKAEFEREGFEKILCINLTGAMQLCTEFHDLLQASGGNIVNLDSVVSIRPALNNPAYSASKAGLVQLTKALAMKWGRNGIRVNSVAPGMVPTKLTVNQSSREQEEQFRKTNPLGRFGTPQDIAGGVLFLASPMAAYVTGQQLVIDGGSTL